MGGECRLHYRATLGVEEVCIEGIHTARATWGIRCGPYIRGNAGPMPSLSDMTIEWCSRVMGKATAAESRGEARELSPRERVILSLIERSGGKMSFAEIGRRLGLSRGRVRSLARRAGSDARRLVGHHMICTHCGNQFRASPYQIEEGKRFCSWQCYMASRRAAAEPASNEQIKQTRITARQAEMLMHLAMGKSYQEVADEFGISRNTVRNQMHRLMKRTGARNSVHALAIALEHGWLDLREKEEDRLSQYPAEITHIVEEIRGRLQEVDEGLRSLEKTLGIVPRQQRRQSDGWGL